MYLFGGMERWRFGLCLLLTLPLLAGTSGCKTSSSSVGKETQGSSLGAESNYEERAEKEELVSFSIVPDPFSTNLSKEKSFVAEWGRINALAHYASGLSLEMNRQSEAAFGEFVQAANADPGNEPLVINVARQLIAMGKQADAAMLLELSSDRKEVSSSVLSWRALALASMGDTKTAIKIAKQAIKKSKDSALSYQVLFGVYLDQGNSKEALKVLKLAEKEAKDSIPFLLELSQLYLNNKDKIEMLGLNPQEEAARLVGQVEELLSNEKEPSPELSEMLGDTYLAIGENQKSLDTYEQLLQHYPGHTVLREKRAAALLALGEDAKAETEFRLLLRENPGQIRYCLILGDIYQQRGQYKEAGDFYYYAATMNPRNSELYLMAGTMRLAEGNAQKALDAFELARTAGLRSYKLEYISAMAYAGLGRYAEAVDAMRLAETIDKEAESENLNIDFYLSLADLYDKKGDRAQTLKIMQELLEKNPDSPECLNALGYTWAEEGIHLEEALEMIQKALKAEPDSPAYLDSMAWALHKLGRSEEGIAYQLRALELTEEHPLAKIIYYDHLGDLYQATGKKEEAQRAWNQAIEIGQSVNKDADAQLQIQKVQKKLQDLK